MTQHFATTSSAIQALDAAAIRVAPQLHLSQSGSLSKTITFMQQEDIDLVMGVSNHPAAAYTSVIANVQLLLVSHGSIGIFPKGTFILQPALTGGLLPVVRTVTDKEAADKILLQSEVVEKHVSSYNDVVTWCRQHKGIKCRQSHGFHTIDSKDANLLFAFKMRWT